MTTYELRSPAGRPVFIFDRLDRFIIPAPNPLVDVLINQVGERLKINPHGTTWHDALREEIRGYEVRKIGEAGE